MLFIIYEIESVKQTPILIGFYYIHIVRLYQVYEEQVFEQSMRQALNIVLQKEKMNNGQIYY